MADLNYVNGRVLAPSRGDAAPVMVFEAQGAGYFNAKTIADCATSKPTDVALDAGQGMSIFRLVAIGGDLWVAAGENPTAVAAAAGTIRLVQGAAQYLAVPAGWKLAAINA